MTFLEDLREYLERPEAARLTFKPDVAAHRRHLLAALEELERNGRPDRDIQWYQTYWSERIEPFAVEMGALLLNKLASGAPPEEIASLINISLSRYIGLDATAGSKVKDRELDRLRALAVKAAEKVARGDREPWQLVAQYAREVRAVMRAGENWAISPIGRLIRELPDRDAIRWMLAVEAVQSRGSGDTWRLARGSAAELLRGSSGVLAWDGSDGAWPATWETLDRLSKLGILTIVDDKKAKTTTFALLPEGRPFLEELATGSSTPFTVLAEALLQDDTSAVLGQIRPVAALVQSEGAAAATTRHARMVAHEIRNALVPVRDALDSLYHDVERKYDKALLMPHQEAIDTGIDRTFKFLKDMVNVAARGVEPSELFDILPSIEDALAAVASDFGARASLHHANAVPTVVGHRDRFTLAIINLLRNAAQARPDGTVKVDVIGGASEVVITVDDNGPGVPFEHRETIFKRGVSMRPGGTGEGLALVREVVEGEMHGRAMCEESPLGGARFVLRLPMNKKKVDR